jgi:hypothetical protein
MAPIVLFCAAVLGNPEQKPEKVAASAILVVASGELNGHLTPCGCSKPMLGGLPRRASYLTAMPGTVAAVRLENGDLTEALGRQDELKAETAVEMLDRMKYDAINLGEKDFRLGTPYLQALGARFKGTLLCANARDDKGAPLFKEETLLTRQIAGRTVRVAVIGLISEQYGDTIHTLSPDVTIESPEAALKRLMPPLLAQSDVRILLYHGPKTEAEALAQQFTMFQLVVCAHEGDVPSAMQPIGACGLVSGGEDGKRLAAVRLQQDQGWRAASTVVTLTPDYADNRDTIEIKKAYLQRVTAESLLDKTPRVPIAGGAAYAGTQACAACHAAADAVWRLSGHAHALRTLAQEGEEKDPECVRCHVVGLERQTGFASHEKTPGLENVGCESCHGPASKHVADPKSRLDKASSASCDMCHVVQHSPHFDFKTYWSKIKHGY